MTQQAAQTDTIREPARGTPVFRTCDVLVVGGGPAGAAAAASAARMGADTILLERYGHLGGMATGGFCLWIDRMSDWSGRQVIGGFASDVLDRMPPEALLGPESQVWGSDDPKLVAYWKERAAAFHGVVTWSPTIDAEMLKIAHQDEVLARGASLVLHGWAVATVQEGNEVKGIVFESKSGRQAILAKVVIDTTGDGDIFALAGARWESDVVKDDIHHHMNVAFLWSGVDMDRYREFKEADPGAHREVMERARRAGPNYQPDPMPRNDQALFMGPRFPGYSSLNVEDLTAVEIKSRRVMMDMIAFYRRNVPGFADAYVSGTAPQMGTRHSRRLVGAATMTTADWQAGRVFDDEIGLSPPPTPRHPNVSVPYGTLVPPGIENLLAAGRLLSCDAITHTFMREVPNCWQMGQAAGVAAAQAISAGVRVQDVDIAALQKELANQGVPMHTTVPTLDRAAAAEPVSSGADSTNWTGRWE
jgi:hypothetical protein